MRTLRPFAALVATTVLEIVRQPLVLLLTLTALTTMGLLPVLTMFNFGEAGKLVRDGALALHFVFGLLIAVAAASEAIARNLRRGTAATVLSKPVGRGLFFLALYSGVAVTLILFSLMAALTTLICARAALLGWETDVWALGPWALAVVSALLVAAADNYGRRRSFVSQAFLWLLPALGLAFLVAAWVDPDGHRTLFGAWIPWRLLPASLLVSTALLVLAAIALGFSTRLPPVFTMTLSVGVFFLGLVSEYLFDPARTSSWAARWARDLLPNWQHFWMIDALSGGGAIAWSYVVQAELYAGCYLVGALALGWWSFRRVEIR